ncbi:MULTISPECIES: lipid III flippase WzxE [Dickeya]|uniref:Lipid III translocase n=1 Tax=Dickeya aquatica TaxID=1401087 RepID=A0A375AG71_9GAMM|nr:MULTISPECIES: lipid III flippase WzxE [Dickeya]SLM64997.1 lipid III translocase [Dickeya aquatica]
MSLARASLWTAASTLVKLGTGLVVIKLLALLFGPQGVGLAGNYRQLITVLGVMAGAGIANGVTRLVASAAAAHHPPQGLGTAVTLAIGFSLLLAAGLGWQAARISRLLFGDEDYVSVIRVLAGLQPGIAAASVLLAALKGFQDAPGSARVVVAASLAGVLAYGICLGVWGYQGALIGLALMPALGVVPAFFILKRHIPMSLQALTPLWSWPHVRQLSRFSLMTLITVLTLPAAYLLMRNQLAALDGWHAVGMWQGASLLSDAWLSLITASFSVYLLPALSGHQHKSAICREVLQALRFVMILAAGMAAVIWLLRDAVIRLLFSADFLPMRDLLAFQLAGDVLKVSAYVFGYLVLAKASLRYYWLAEISQFLLLTGFARWLIPKQGALGASQAYLLSYLVYFLLCSAIFWRYCRQR